MMQQRPFLFASRLLILPWSLLFALHMGTGQAQQPARVGPEFQVNTFTADNQLDPAIAMDDAGRFVVTWYSVGQDGTPASVYAQRFDAQGTLLGPEFRVNTFVNGSQQFPAIAMNGAGDFVIVWSSLHQDGSKFGIFAQRFNAQGARVGPEFQVNSFTADHQLDAAMAMDHDGRFVVSWSSRGGSIR